ncbi:nucleic acid-binding, OB-fold protein [Tanacetum coccineum]
MGQDGVSSYSVGQKRKRSENLRWRQIRRATAHFLANQPVVYLAATILRIIYYLQGNAIQANMADIGNRDNSKVWEIYKISQYTTIRRISKALLQFSSYNQLDYKIPRKDGRTLQKQPTLTGCLMRVGNFRTLGSANTNQINIRKLDIENLNGDVVELMLWDEMARELNKEQFELMEKCRKVSKYGAINTAIDWYYESCSNCIRKVTDGNGVRQFVDHRPQPYNYKAFISDGSSTALFTFFTPNANVLTGSDCTQLIKVHNTPGPLEDGRIEKVEGDNYIQGLVRLNTKKFESVREVGEVYRKIALLERDPIVRDRIMARLFLIPKFLGVFKTLERLPIEKFATVIYNVKDHLGYLLFPVAEKDFDVHNMGYACALLRSLNMLPKESFSYF